MHALRNGPLTLRAPPTRTCFLLALTEVHGYEAIDVFAMAHVKLLNFPTRSSERDRLLWESTAVDQRRDADLMQDHEQLL